MTVDTIIQILDELCKRLGIAVDWTAENIMPYIKMAMTEVATTKQTLWLILMIVASITFATMIAFTIVHMCRKQYSYDDDVAFVIGIAVALVFLIITVVNFVEWKCMPDIKAIKWIIEAVKAKR